MGCFVLHYCNPPFYQGKFFPQMRLWNKTISISELQGGFTVGLPGELHSVQVTSPIEVNLKFKWENTISAYFCKNLDPMRHGCNIRGTADRLCTRQLDNAFTSYPACTKFIADIRKRVSLEILPLEFLRYLTFYFLKCLGKDHLFTSGKWQDHYQYHKDSHGMCRVNHFEPSMFSWADASDTCKDMESSLPIFLSRSNQEDFIMSIKTFPELFPMEAVFLGLRQSQGVSTCVPDCENILVKVWGFFWTQIQIFP